MECERLIKLIKSWYLAVQDESLAPARMVSFMQNHIINCNVCLNDLEVQHEVDKITEIILPPSKVKIASKTSQKDDDAENTNQPQQKDVNDDSDTSDSENEDDNDNDNDEEDEDDKDEENSDDYEDEATLGMEDDFQQP